MAVRTQSQAGWPWSAHCGMVLPLVDMLEVGVTIY